MKKQIKNQLFTRGRDSCTSSGCGGCMYGLGFLGAAIYYVSTATGFWMGVLGILKALVWPAFIVYEVMQYLAL